MKPTPRIVHIVLVIAILMWYGIMLAQKIDLTTADLGRHIKNGEIWLTADDRHKLLGINFYSFTEPDYPFINHHWGSGVVFFLIVASFGFSALSYFYIVLGIVTFLFFFDIARKMSNVYIASSVSSLLMPIMASRVEVRPEIFTYFFTGLFFWMLWRYHFRKIDYRFLFLLPIGMLVWVNLHVGFFMGIVLVGVFLIFNGTSVINKRLLLILVLSSIAVMLNPNGLTGALYPLNIFRNYGYLIVENQSVRFLESLGHTNGLHFTLFKVVAGLVVFLSFIAIIFTKRTKFFLALFCMVVFTLLMAYSAIRNFPFFGFFAVPFLAMSVHVISRQNAPRIREKHWLAIMAVLIMGCGYRDVSSVQARRLAFGAGLAPGTNASAEFFKRINLTGPIFNNYDIGSYLIYHLFPKERVFVDNRPEAYSTDFFQKVYIPMQQDEKLWQELDRKYNFNVIFFSHRDFTPWGQKFLIDRVQDPDFAPVFVDNYNIIFLKRNARNEPIIKKYEMPKDRFSTSKL